MFDVFSVVMRLLKYAQLALSLISDLYSKIKKYFGEWRSRTPKQKWQTVYNIGAFLAESIGVTVYSDMQNYWFSYFSEVMGSIYFITTSYTVLYYFGRQEYLRGLQATCAIGIIVACLITQIQTLRPVKCKMNNLINFGGKYIYTDENQTPKMRVFREKMVSKLIQNTSIVVITLIVAFIMFGITTAYLVVFKGARVTFLGTELPFFEKDSDIGFWLYIFFQLVISGLGCFGCLAIEIATCLTINAVAAIPYLICVDGQELHKELISNGTSLGAQARLRNILMKVQDYERLVQDAIESFYMRLFVGPFLFVYSIVFSIFGQLLLGYPSGYLIAFANYLFLLICCHLGETIEKAKAGIESELYDTPWYLLPAKSQNQICCVMHMIQNGSFFTIGPFSRLNMETAADLSKLIYRLTMLLFRIFD